MATIKDVANHAGVSIATVSNVLNNTRRVSPRLKKKVEDAVEELNYRVNMTARNMKMKNTRVIGVVVNSLNTIFMPQVINGIQRYAADAGYQLLFYCSDLDFAREQQYISMLLDNQVDGIVINSVASYKQKDYFRSLASLCVGSKRVHTVSLERNLAACGVPSVHVDNLSGGKMATEYLLEKGCRRVVAIAGPKNLDIIQERIQGYCASLKEAKLAYDESLLIQGDYSTLSGYLGVRRLLLDGNCFDAVFSCNDQMAIGALKALRENRRSIPNDVKIVGFDNTFVSSLTTPGLTTINVPKYRMGTIAAQKLIDLIEGRGANDPLATEIPISIIRRASTDPDMDNGIDLEW